MLGMSAMSEGVTDGSASDPDGDYAEHSPVIRLLLAIRRSLLLFTITLGVVMILSSIVVELAFANQGVFAAMLLIWGVSAIIFGVLGFVVMLVLGLR